LHLSEREFLTLFFLSLLLGSFATGSLTFEILSHYYRENDGFKVKRFGKRILLILIFSAIFLLTYNVLYVFLSSILAGKHILILNGVISSLTFCVLIKKFKRFKKLIIHLSI
jgi:uncharacterized membrane protein